MRNININQSIRTVSSIGRLIVIFALAILLGQSFWWFFNPLGYTTFDNIVSGSFNSDGLAQGIVNRAPFGIVTTEKAPQPGIIDQVKLVGVYAGGPNNSIAFIQVNGTNKIAQIGDNILDAKLQSINSNNITLAIGSGQTVTINITSGGASSSRMGQDNNPGQNQANNFPQNQQQQMNMNQQEQNNSNDNNANNSSNSENNEAAIAEKRRKMIEAFQKQNAANNDK